MFRDIKPIGLRIINAPQLGEWTAKGQASQESDGLWLHYAAICTLLRESEEAAHREERKRCADVLDSVGRACMEPKTGRQWTNAAAAIRALDKDHSEPEVGPTGYERALKWAIEHNSWGLHTALFEEGDQGDGCDYDAMVDEWEAAEAVAPERKVGTQVESCQTYNAPHNCPKDHITHSRPDLFCEACGQTMVKDIRRDILVCPRCVAEAVAPEPKPEHYKSGVYRLTRILIDAGADLTVMQDAFHEVERDALVAERATPASHPGEAPCKHNTRTFKGWAEKCVDCGTIVNWEPHTEATKFVPEREAFMSAEEFWMRTPSDEPQVWGELRSYAEIWKFAEAYAKDHARK